MEIKALIEGIIAEEVAGARPPLPYRAPIVGYADADDPLFGELTGLIGAPQALPTDLLPAARTVVVYFIPFSEEMAHIARRNPGAPEHPEWSAYYEITNRLLADLAARLVRELYAAGVSAAAQPPTGNYDAATLTARWPHKSAAVIAGIGSFGLNHLVITRLGTMGRLGSIVIDRHLPPTRRPETPFCLYYRDGSCAACVKNCPSGALRVDGLDKFRCDRYLNETNRLPGQHGCYNCSRGPCALRGFSEG